MYFKIILFLYFLSSTLALNPSAGQNKWSGTPLKRSMRQTLEEIPIDFNEEPKESTEAPVEATNGPTTAETTSDEPKEEPIKDDLNVKKEGEKIEREDEESSASPPPKESEPLTPSSPSPLPPVTTASIPTQPSRPMPTAPPSRPVFPLQPEGYPSPSFPNYWQNPNWGNWGRFIPTQPPNWSRQWPTLNNWPSIPSAPSVPSVATIPQYPSYSPSNYSPYIYTTSRYRPFSMSPSSGVPVFSFSVPQNPYPSGRGFEYPTDSQPSIPTYSGFQPSYQPSYQPRFIPSGGPPQGLIPGVGGRTPTYYPGMGGERPSYYPGSQPQTPSLYPGSAQIPSAQPGADPKRPMGPTGPEYMDDSDVAMIDPQTGGSRGMGGHGITFPGNLRRTIIRL